MKNQVRADTEAAVKNALEKDEPVLIEAPPASGKTYNAVRVAQKEDLNVTYLAARRDLYAQAEEEAKEADDTLEYMTIPAPQRNCPTFSGEKGDTRQAQRLYNKGRSGRQIHYSDTVHTPCQTPDTDCPYIEKLERVESETDTFDSLIGNYQHAYKEDYLEDRVVIFYEFNPSPFVEWFPSESEINDSPGEIIAEFLEAVEEIPYDDLTDVIEARELSKASEGADLEWEWFRKNGAGRKTTKDQIELTPNRYDAAHSYAALLTLGLMFGTSQPA